MTNRYQKRLLALCLLLLGVAGLHPDARAQRVVNVAPGYATLNDAIAADANPDEAVFVLQRGEEYILSEAIRYEGEILRVHGAEGEGDRAVIYAGVDLTGVSQNLFMNRSDLELKNLVLRGIDETGADTRNPIRLAMEGARIVIDNVLMETAGQSFIRFDAPGMSLFITNSVARNMGITDSPGNGRVFDTRNNDADTIWVQNNTFYQNLAQQVRTDNGYVRYFLWDHNTSMNSGGYGIDLSRAVEARVTNSIFVDLYAIGDDGTQNAGLQIDSLGTAHGFTDDDREIVIENINYYTRPVLRDAVIAPDVRPMTNFLDSIFVHFITAGVVDTHNVFVEELDLENPPPDMIAYAQYYYSGETSDFPAWRAYEDPTWHDDPTLVGDLPANHYDFTYPASARSYTAATNGFPLGDLNWYPELLEEWTATDVEDGAGLPATFRLHGNFPNPFNPSTIVRFDLPAAAQVSVVVFDLLGRRVHETPALLLPAGDGAQVQVDASSLPSGLYLYQVRAETDRGTLVQSGRMTLVK